MIRECKDCKYWEKNEGDEERGLCHRYAPRPIVGEEFDEIVWNGFAHWPITYCDDGCGDSELREGK